MKHPPYYFPQELRREVGSAIGESLILRMKLVLLAMCVQSWHTHFVTAATARDVADVVKCAKDAVRWRLRTDRPIWAADYDKRFCYDAQLVQIRIDYVERHNLRDGLPRRPWPFIRDWHEPLAGSFSPR